MDRVAASLDYWRITKRWKEEEGGGLIVENVICGSHKAKGTRRKEQKTETDWDGGEQS